MSDSPVLRHEGFSKGWAYVDALGITGYTGRVISVMDEDGNGASFDVPRRIPDDLRAEFEATRGFRSTFRSSRCSHQRREIRKKIASNGSPMVSAQCLDCGAQAGNYLKKAEWPQVCPSWDDGASGNHPNITDNYDDPLARFYLRVIAALQAEESGRKEEYSEYLLSPEWREKRRLVLERDGYLCQGCRKAKATEVHHLTYRNIYKEFLFELTSLCEKCHDDIHEAED